MMVDTGSPTSFVDYVTALQMSRHHPHRFRPLSAVEKKESFSTPPSPPIGKPSVPTPVCNVHSDTLHTISTRWAANKYPELFRRMGRFNNHVLRTSFKSHFQATQQKGRRVPLDLETRVCDKIERLISEGHVKCSPKKGLYSMGTNSSAHKRSHNRCCTCITAKP